MLLHSNSLQRLRRFIPTDDARVSLARDIHDGIAQDLVAVGYQLDSLLAQPGIDARTKSGIRDVRLAITQTLNKVRRELFDLRQDVGKSLKDSLSDLYRELATGFAGSTDIEDVSLSDVDEKLVHDIARELLANASRHSKGSSIWLSLLASGNRIVLTVSDDGVGGIAFRSGHFGLLGVQERLDERGGTLTMSGKLGSTVVVSLPL